MAEPQPVFFKDSARRVQCKMKVNKLQFVCLIGGRILTWGRRVPASVLPCWGSRPQHGNALNRRAFACQGIEP